MARILHGLRVSKGRPAFLTLTSLPGTSVEEMMGFWNRYRGFLRRVAPEFEYAAVKQFGSLHGLLHLHVALLDWSYVPRAILKAEWERVSGSFICDIREIKGDREKVAKYIARYISRELANTEVAKCVTYSKGFPRLPTFDKRWRVSGDIVGHVPPGRLVGEMGGCLVVRNRGCECLAGVRDLGLDGHLALWRIQERGPP